MPPLETVRRARGAHAGCEDEGEAQGLDEPEPPGGAEPFLAEHPVGEEEVAGFVVAAEHVGRDDDDERRHRDAHGRAGDAGDPGAAPWHTELEADELVAGDDEERVRGALQREEVGVGAHDEDDGEGAQPDTGLHRAPRRPSAHQLTQPTPRTVQGPRIARRGKEIRGGLGSRAAQRIELGNRHDVPARGQLA